MNKPLSINFRVLFNGVLFLPHYKNFRDLMTMEKEAAELLECISQLTNIYGFTARHYVKESAATEFIFTVHKEIVRGFHIKDEELKNRILDFVERYNELNSKIEKQ